MFSLGDRCLTANKLSQFKLRPYAGIIDWMLSPNLLSINRLLKNQCRNFMKKENLVCDGYNQLIFGHLLLRDLLYDVISVHDFSITENTPENLIIYPEFKTKIDQKVQRFLNKLKTCTNILFVRIGGTYEEAKLLELTLSQIVAHEFRLLIINEEPIN
ncbi:papain-like cysteine peptidase [Bacillus wiedmannii]|uniref:papain-like cysteine peptidase n=1 Tax=Bacillus wiedmannii TaxID=1890302 RepID=UPI00211D414E|nr:papain-like cysteine peptidase [Bacillus wiedmannii]